MLKLPEYNTFSTRYRCLCCDSFFFFFQAEDGIRDLTVTGFQTCALPILPARSRDEFGQVTEAFNAVHLEAVRTAAEQAALRSSVSTMFVNLARRSQILVDRLIGHLDRLERGEEDPDRLAGLFQLDPPVAGPGRPADRPPPPAGARGGGPRPAGRTG